MSRDNNPPATDEVAHLARELAASAGYDTEASSVTGALGTNANAIVALASGERYVYRRYLWDGPGSYAPRARMRREAWQFAHLGRPRVVAEADDPPALLLEFIPGDTLGDLAARGEASQDQWQDTGAAFRALHELTATQARDAGIEVEPDDPPRDLASVAERLDSLASSRPDLDLSAAREAHTAASSAPRGSALIHGDAHMWNVLAGEECVLIDLEKSAGGDPDFDIAYFDGLRFSDGIGPIPEAFFDGYGRRPLGPWYALHRIGIAATVTDIVARGYRRLAWDVARAEHVLRTGGSDPSRRRRP